LQRGRHPAQRGGERAMGTRESRSGEDAKGKGGRRAQLGPFRRGTKRLAGGQNRT